MSNEWRQKSAAERARWLAEVAEALETTRILLAGLAAQSTPTRESRALAELVAGAIGTVEALRRGGRWQVSEAPRPKWTKQSPDRLNWRG